VDGINALLLVQHRGDLFDTILIAIKVEDLDLAVTIIIGQQVVCELLIIGG
jgi:hypothetical protein